jgi:hypothetical protein
LIQTYNQDAAADKDFIAQKHLLFIGERLKLITEELNGVEQDVQSLRSQIT